MAFIYGAKDSKGSQIAKASLENVRGTRKDLTQTAERAIPDTDLVGSKLLQETLPTEELIIDKYLENVMEKRGSRERKKREIDKYRFFWAFPKPGPGARVILSKMPSDEQQGPIHLDQLGLGVP